MKMHQNQRFTAQARHTSINGIEQRKHSSEVKKNKGKQEELMKVKAEINEIKTALEFISVVS